MFDKRIGVAGCGRMGEPMLAALLHGGFNASGFDVRAPSSYGDFASHMSDDPKAFAEHLQVLIVVVRDIAQTETLLFDVQAILQHAPQLEFLIISSTLSPRYLLELRDRVPAAIHMVDAPMSGAAIAAQERRLSFMLGGSDRALNTLQPVFDAMGSNFHRMGGLGSGMRSKVLNNLLASSHTAMTRLVLDWARDDRLGPPLDEAKLLQLIQTSSGQNWLASGFDTIEFAKHGFEEDNSIGILVKDVESALDAAPEGSEQELLQIIQAALRKLEPYA